MSYYEEGGMGLALPTGLKFSTAAPAATGGPGKMPADLVMAMSNAMNGNFAANDAVGQKIRQTGVLLAAMVRNAKGAPVDAKAVLSLLLGITSTSPGGNGWINNAFASSGYAPLNAMTIESIVSDIGNGKYAPPAPAAPSAQLAPLKIFTTIAATAALKSQVAATAAANAQTKQAVADQAVTKATQTQSSTDQVAAQQAQSAADQAAAAAQAAAQDAANAATQVASPGDQTSVSPSDLVPSDSGLVFGPDAGTSPATTTATGSSVPWLYIGLGAAALAGAGWFFMGRKSTPNRRSRKNRHRHSKRTRRARKA